MRLLLDQGTPRSSASALRQAGFDTVHTGEIGLAEAEDAEIIHLAKTEDRIVITYDSDFHMILALEQAQKPSIIRIRIEGLRSGEFSDLVLYILDQVSDDILKGAVVSVNEKQIRVRRLPLS